jgi:hypothetical protein
VWRFRGQPTHPGATTQAIDGCDWVWEMAARHPPQGVQRHTTAPHPTCPSGVVREQVQLEALRAATPDEGRQKVQTCLGGGPRGGGGRGAGTTTRGRSGGARVLALLVVLRERGA